MTKETNSIDQLFDELDTKADASAIDEVKLRLEALEDANAKRSSIKTDDTKTDEKADKLAASNLIIKGAANYNLSLKATDASITVDAEGGYALPKIFNPEVTDYIRKTSPLFALAKVINSGSKYSTLIKIDGSDARTRTEKGTLEAGTVDTYAEIVMGQFDVYDSQKWTAWAEEGDAVIDLAGEVVRSVGENMGEKMASELMLGTTTNTLNGVSDVTSINTGLLTLTQAAGNADRFTNSIGKLGVFSAEIADDGTDDWFGIFADYFSTLHSKFKGSTSHGVIISSELELKLRKSQDANKNFQWAGAQGVAGAQPGTIWGVPYYVDDFLPTIATAAGKPVALVGDFSKYIVNQYSPVKMIRDEVTAPGFIKYHSRQRIGGVLTDFQAVRGLVLTVASGD